MPFSKSGSSDSRDHPVAGIIDHRRASANRASGNPNSKGNDTTEIESENASFMVTFKDG
jgi:hypothetical protein